MEDIASSVTTAKSTQPRVDIHPAKFAQSKPATKNKPSIPRHSNYQTKQTGPATYAIPGNQGQTSQDHYQELDPGTLQQDATVQYEPLRIKDAVTRTDLRNDTSDTYEPLRNRPADYPSLQKYSKDHNTSFS